MPGEPTPREAGAAVEYGQRQEAPAPLGRADGWRRKVAGQGWRPASNLQRLLLRPAVPLRKQSADRSEERDAALVCPRPLVRILEQLVEDRAQRAAHIGGDRRA